MGTWICPSTPLPSGRCFPRPQNFPASLHPLSGSGSDCAPLAPRATGISKACYSSAPQRAPAHSPSAVAVPSLPPPPSPGESLVARWAALGRRRRLGIGVEGVPSRAPQPGSRYSRSRLRRQSAAQPHGTPRPSRALLRASILPRRGRQEEQCSGRAARPDVYRAPPPGGAGGGGCRSPPLLLLLLLQSGRGRPLALAAADRASRVSPEASAEAGPREGGGLSTRAPGPLFAEARGVKLDLPSLDPGSAWPRLLWSPPRTFPYVSTYF